MGKLPDSLARHSELALLGRPSIRSELDAGRFSISSSTSIVDRTHLLSIYTIRREHLATLAGGYFEQLRESVTEFCAALERTPPACGVALESIELDNGISISLFERADTHELLGYLVGIDQRKASPADWDSLWGAG